MTNKQNVPDTIERMAKLLRDQGLSDAEVAAYVQSAYAVLFNKEVVTPMLDAIGIRNQECVTVAAKKIFGIQSEGWRPLVDVASPAIIKEILSIMQNLGYKCTEEHFKDPIEPTDKQAMQELCVYSRWLQANPQRSSSGPFAKRYNEYKALMYMNADFIASGLDIEHSSELERSRLAGYLKFIQQPTQTARYQ